MGGGKEKNLEVGLRRGKSFEQCIQREIELGISMRCDLSDFSFEIRKWEEMKLGSGF